MYKSLMSLILKKESFDDRSGNDLLRVDLSGKCNYLKRKDIHLSFENANVLQDLIVKSIITVSSASVFRQEYRQMTIDMLQKLLQKKPLVFSRYCHQTFAFSLIQRILYDQI